LKTETQFLGASPHLEAVKGNHLPGRSVEKKGQGCYACGWTLVVPRGQ
jgi:hypothetical protein